MSITPKKKKNKTIEQLIAVRQSIPTQELLLSILQYQQQVLLNRSSCLKWVCNLFSKFQNNVLPEGFRHAYQSLTSQNQRMYYVQTIKLAKQIHLQNLKRTKQLQTHLQVQKQLHQQIRIKRQFFQDIVIFSFKKQNSLQNSKRRQKINSTNKFSQQQQKIIYNVISATGNYLQLQPIQTYKFSNKKTYDNNLQKIAKQKDQAEISYHSAIVNNRIIVDLRQYILRIQPNREDSDLQFLKLIKFVRQGQRGQNKVIKSSDSINKIYIDIRRYFNYKFRVFKQFCLQAYQDYIKLLINPSEPYGVQIHIKKEDQLMNYQNKEELIDTQRNFLGSFLQQNTQKKQNPILLAQTQTQTKYLNFRHPRDYLEQQQYGKFQSKYQIKLNQRFVSIWDDWILKENSKLIFNNKEILSTQKGIVGHLIKQVLLNIAKGKNFYATTLPLQIFQRNSLVEKVCVSLGYAPLAFRQLNSRLNKKQQFKMKIKGILTMLMGYCILQVRQMAKPFNSVLGETYQGYLNGCLISAQQISHHPPISSFYMKEKRFTLYGSLEPSVSVGLNTIVEQSKGFVSVSFENQQHNDDTIHFTFPRVQISGIVVGDRFVIQTGVSYIFSEKQNFYARIQWGKKKNQLKSISSQSSQKANPNNYDYMQGKVFKVRNGVSVNKQNCKDIQKKDLDCQLFRFNGNWTSSLFIQDQLEFDFANQMPYKLVQYQAPLPSHSNFRNDIIFRRQNDMQKSQQAKIQIEQLKRHDKKLRQKHKSSFK